MEAKIFALLSLYFKAKSEHNIQEMWELIYDWRGNREYDFFDQMNREYTDFRKAGMNVGYTLVEVKNIRKKEKDSTYRSGGWTVTVVYQVSGWQREKEMVMVEKLGELYIDYNDIV